MGWVNPDHAGPRIGWTERVGGILMFATSYAAFATTIAHDVRSFNSCNANDSRRCYGVPGAFDIPHAAIVCVETLHVVVSGCYQICGGAE